MNYLENWIDASKISKTGWGGTSVYDDINHCMVLTAVNGWNSFFWTIPDVQDKEVYFEFDYRFTILDNWNSCYIINSNSYGSVVAALSKKTDWTHIRAKMTCSEPYIGMNVRGTDETGKTLAVAIKNVRLYLNSTFSNEIRETGNIQTMEIIEDTTCSFYSTGMYCGDIIEN